jgi:hypothetical protein
VALQPSDTELEAAQRWVETPDASEAEANFVREVITHVRAARR